MMMEKLVEGIVLAGEAEVLGENLQCVGLERGPLSLVRITEELLEWKSSGFRSRRPRFNGRGDPFR
jgi:hypothetical protein